MKTTTLKEISETTNGNVSPEFYYEWGNEPTGYVTTYCYIDDTKYTCGVIRKDEAVKAGLKFNCPYS